MALRKQDIFGFRLDTLHRNVHISWRISGGRMRGILDPAAGAVNKNSNEKNHRERLSLQLRALSFWLAST